jgi:G:T-mismatch repair DNA endonuclease (very short patch repair protein)
MESLRKIMKGGRTKPNKLESYLSQMLQQFCPNEWKYVGDGEVIIGGKCPDFININGKKQVIEFMGNYWHPLFDGANRIEHYKQYGFECFVIWQDELKDIEKLTKKVKKLAMIG